MKKITLKQAIKQLKANVVWHKDKPVSLRIGNIYTLINGDFVIVETDKKNVYKIMFC